VIRGICIARLLSSSRERPICGSRAAHGQLSLGDHLTTVVGAIAVERPSLEAGNVGPKAKTGYVRPDDVRVRYSILERPPWHETILLGFQVSEPRSIPPRPKRCRQSRFVPLCDILTCP